MDLLEMAQTPSIMISVAMENVIRVSREMFPDNMESQAASILVTAAITCFDIATSHVCASNNMQADDVMDNIISTTYEYWCYAVDYCKQEHNIELHALGVLFILKTIITSDETIAYSNQIVSAIDRFCKKLDAEINDVIKTTRCDDDHEVDIDVEDMDQLIARYFQLLNKIGTFHHDRNSYETDEQRDAHDQIMAIYKKICGYKI